jgi:hypothetical protein
MRGLAGLRPDRSEAGLQDAGFKHIPRSQPLRTHLKRRAKSVVPSADPAIGNPQHCLTGTHHSVSREHLQVYFDKFVFRDSRCRLPIAAFQTSLGLGHARKATHHSLIRGIADLLTLTPEDLGLAVTT